MKGFKKYLVAVCVVALLGALLAGCSSQSSSSAASSSASASASSSASASASASSAASQASTDELIKELEAIPGLENVKSVTIDMKGDITMDLNALAASLTDSSASASASASSASAASSSSAASSEDSTLDIPIEMLIKADSEAVPQKMYMKMNMMGVPFELYVQGDNAVLVVEGEAYSGTLADFGMEQYGSLDTTLTSSGTASFSDYKNAIESITKEKVGNDAVYTVVVDSAKIDGGSIANTLAQAGISADASKITMTYIIGADGNLSEMTMDLGGEGFSMTQDVKISDIDSTVVPDAPAATKSFAEYQQAMGTAAAA